MNEQQYIMQMNMLEQEANQMEQQIQAIDQQVSELGSLKESLEAIKEGKNQNMLANLGKGIFVETEIKSKELLVNVGRNILLKKNPGQAIEIIDAQLVKLASGREQILERIENLQENMQAILLDAQRNAGKSGKHNSHDNSCSNENCECEEPCEDCSCEHGHAKKR